MSAQYLDRRTDLIWQPDVRVSTFESGLILVQQSAVCRSTLNQRSQLEIGDRMPTENTGAIDGIFIFPAPQERREVAFTTYDVSGYGRTTTGFRTTFAETIISVASYTIDDETYTRSFTAATARQIGVIRSSESLVPQSPPVSRATWRWVTVDGDGNVVSRRTGRGSWIQTSLDRTNYGTFDEAIVTWSATFPSQLPA